MLDATTWSSTGSHEIVIDITPTDDPVITTDGGSGEGADYTTTDSSITLTGACAADTYAVYVNGSTDGVSYTPGETSWTYAGTLSEGTNIFDITAYDAAGNPSLADSITITYEVPNVPIGGYSEDNVIPAAQDDQKIISQSTDGNGIITIKFKIKHAMEVVGCTLHTFQYSVDGGENWKTPQNEDNSECLNQAQDPTWPDNDGARYASAADFDSAEEHSFTFTTKHADVTGLDNVEQDDVRIRFMINDGTDDSPSPVTSVNFRVDNDPPFAPSW